MRSCSCSTLHRVRRLSPPRWGTRKLAYPINYKTEGYYVLMTFVSGPAFPRELDRKLRIAEGVMRSLIVCKDE